MGNVGSRGDDAAFSDVDAGPDVHERVQPDPGPDHRPALDNAERSDGRGRIDPGVAGDHGRPIDAGRNGRRGVEEAEQIVTTVRRNNVPVWYILADNEGHGFARKDNADFYFAAMTLFLERVLGV